MNRRQAAARQAENSADTNDERPVSVRVCATTTGKKLTGKSIPGCRKILGEQGHDGGVFARIVQGTPIREVHGVHRRQAAVVRQAEVDEVQVTVLEGHHENGLVFQRRLISKAHTASAHELQGHFRENLLKCVIPRSARSRMPDSGARSTSHTSTFFNDNGGKVLAISGGVSGSCARLIHTYWH